MKRGSGLPARPSLSHAPHNLSHTTSGVYSQYQQSAVPHLQSGQNNPYQYYVSSHYAQAYMPSVSFPAQGSMLHGQYYTPAGPSNQQNFTSRSPAPWAQPGGVRCKNQGCQFTGSQKSVEIHMMDRHLVYPPGWDDKKRKPDWDADPSLKGKTIPIQGTNIKLDTPEAIELWIAERKKRFPTAERVEDKQKKMNDAISRGQLPFEDPRFPNKKRRLNDSRNDGRSVEANFRGRGRGRGYGRGRGRIYPSGDRSPGTPSDLPAHVPTERSEGRQTQLDVSTPAAQDNEDEDATSDSDSDGAPEVLSSKPTLPEDVVEPLPSIPPLAATESEHAHRRKPIPKQPRRPLQNPFAARPAFLRNLLLPEIRMTVSNLSQAIRFLVDNDFLENVELRPGQAQEKMLEVISSTDAAADASVPLGDLSASSDK